MCHSLSYLYGSLKITDQTALTEPTGISPLRGSHPAVPIAFGAASSLRLWLYGSIIIHDEKSSLRSCQRPPAERWSKSLASFHPSFHGSWRTSPTARFHHKVSELLLYCADWALSLSRNNMHRRGQEGKENQLPVSLYR